MCDRAIAPLLRELRSGNAGDAWLEFLDSYGAVLYHTAHSHTHDEDAAADCYVYMCEQLADKHFKRMLKFDPDGRASFATWLRVVARNLCFDWHRTQSGRRRPFRALHHLSALELEIYKWRFQRGASRQETIQEVANAFPAVGSDELDAIEDRLHNSLSPRQRWILSTHQEPQLSTTLVISGEESELGLPDVADPKPNQELVLLTNEKQTQLRNALASLPSDERLLLQLRFQDELSLDEVARLCGLGDGQRAHRRIAVVLKKLRSVMR